jgi:carbonic anhydrase
LQKQGEPPVPIHAAPSPTRRFLLGSFACGCAVAMAGGLHSAPARAADAAHTDLTADQALDMLRRGNQDFVNDRQPQVAMNRARRLEIAKGQTPFAVLVGCSDSRVAPELLFGRGLGELFIVRVAGNTVDRTALGSIEYGVAELGCPLVVVMGHERCGAVQAAVKAVTDDTRFPGAIGEMVAPIIPAVLRAQRMQGDLVANAVKENVRQVVRRLSETDVILSDPVQKGKVKIAGAYYNLGDGSVEFL